jgi:hypothetical protein
MLVHCGGDGGALCAGPRRGAWKSVLVRGPVTQQLAGGVVDSAGGGPATEAM